MKHLTTFFIFLFSVFLKVNAQDLYWLQQEGGTSDDYARAVVVDDDNNVWVGIDFEGTIDVGNTSFTAIGETDFVIVKYDSTGNYLGAKQFGGTLQNRIRDLAVYNGNVVGIGFAHNFQNINGVNYPGLGGEDMFIFKMNTNFVVLDLYMMGSSSSDQGYEIAVDDQGNIYFAGYFRGTGNILGDMIPHLGNTDAVFGKIDWNGNLVWAQNAGSSSYDAAFAMDLVNDSTLVIGGEFIGTLNIDGQTINSPVVGNDQSWIVQMDSAGNYQWHYIASDVGYNAVQTLGSDMDGNIYVAGYLQIYNTTFGNNDTILNASGGRDTYLLKLNEDGSFAWIRQGQSFDWFVPNDLTVYDDNVYLTGYYSDDAYITPEDTFFYSGGSNDFYLLNIKTNGDLDWYIAGGGSGNDVGMSVSTDSDGRIALASAISNGFQVDGSPVFTSAGGTDALISFHSPCEFPFLNLNIAWEDSACLGDDLQYEVIDADTNALYTIYNNFVQVGQATWDGSGLYLEIAEEDLSLGQNTITFSVKGEGCIEDLVANAQVYTEVLSVPNVSFTLSQSEGTVTAISTSQDQYGLIGPIWSVDNSPIMSISDTLTYSLTPGQHEICLEEENIYGCEAEACEEIDISTGINEVYRERLQLKFNSAQKLLSWSNKFKLNYQVFDLNGSLLTQGENGNQADLSMVNTQLVIYRLFTEKEEFATGKIFIK